MKKQRWLLFGFAALLTTALGLLYGHLRRDTYMGKMQERTDFMLIDDKGGFFRLSKLPENHLALLIFTPDGIPPKDTPPMADFAKKMKLLEPLNVQIFLVTRTHKEIARNFKSSARFDRPMLIDTSGSVGRILGVWPSLEPIETWGYALVDNRFATLWAARSPRLLSYQEVRDKLEKVFKAPL